MIASLSAFVDRLLSLFSSLVAGLPDWGQDVVSGLILATLVGAVAATWNLAKKALRRRRTKKPASTISRPTPPQMGLIETLAAIPASSMRIRTAMGRMTTAMGAFQQRQAVIQAKTPNDANKQAVIKYFEAGAKSINQLSEDISKNLVDFEGGIDTLRQAALARMYWHDERNTAGDLLDPEAKTTFTTLLAIARKTKETFKNNQARMQGLRGWYEPLTKAADRHEVTLGQLVADIESFEQLTSEMLSFHRERKGLRGLWRRTSKSAQSTGGEVSR